MSSTGTILGTALGISEQMVWQLNDIARPGQQTQEECQHFNDGIVELNQVLRDIIQSYRQALCPQKLTALNNAMESLWQIVSQVYPQFLQGKITDYDKWKKIIAGLEEITALQIMLCREAEDSNKLFAA